MSVDLHLSANEITTVREFIAKRPPNNDFGAMVARYGDFRPRAGHATVNGGDADWYHANIVSLDIGLNIVPGGTSIVYVHRLIAPLLAIGFREIRRLGLANKLHVWSGCWLVRAMRTSGRWSMHSFGCAFDLDGPTNAQGTKGDMDPAIAEIFVRLGFSYGGYWTGRYRDAMHFEGTDNLPDVPTPAWQDAAAKLTPYTGQPAKPAAQGATVRIFKGETQVGTGTQVGDKVYIRSES